MDRRGVSELLQYHLIVNCCIFCWFKSPQIVACCVGVAIIELLLDTR